MATPTVQPGRAEQAEPLRVYYCDCGRALLAGWSKAGAVVKKTCKRCGKSVVVRIPGEDALE